MDVAVLRVLVTCEVLRECVNESVARIDDMEKESQADLVFDGMPDGRLLALLGKRDP